VRLLERKEGIRTNGRVGPGALRGGAGFNLLGGATGCRGSCFCRDALEGGGGLRDGVLTIGIPRIASFVELLLSISTADTVESTPALTPDVTGGLGRPPGRANYNGSNNNNISAAEKHNTIKYPAYGSSFTR